MLSSVIVRSGSTIFCVAQPAEDERGSLRAVVLVAALAGFLIFGAWVPMTVFNVAGVPQELRWVVVLSCPGFLVRWPGMPKVFTSSTICMAVGIAAVANAVIYGGVAFAFSCLFRLVRRVRRHSRTS